MSGLSAWSQATRNVLQAPALHRELSSMVRRRVPRGEVEDVVQGVLCDALAAANVPASPAEVPRWVMGIARHKVADFHRRSRREQALEAVEAIPLLDPIEDRLLLREVLDDSERKPESTQALRWVVRELAGERLHDLAREADLPAEVVRQRVSRFRRKMRARWLAAAAAIIAGVGLIVSRPSARLTALSQAPAVTVSGPQLQAATPLRLPTDRATSARYHVAELRLPSLLDRVVGEWAGQEARSAEISWHGDRVTIVTATRRIEGRVALTKQPDDVEVGNVLLDDGRSLPVRVHTVGPRTTVELVAEGDAASNVFGGGSVVLER